MIRAKEHKINGSKMSEFSVLGDKRHMHFAHHKEEKWPPSQLLFIITLKEGEKIGKQIVLGLNHVFLFKRCGSN